MSTQSAVLVEKSENQIAQYKPFEKELADFKKKYSDIVYDLNDPEQEKQARKDRLAIGKVISKLDKIHDEIKAPLKLQVDLIDNERKRIKDDLVSVQENIKSQIAEHERKQQELADKLQGMVDEIVALGRFVDNNGIGYLPSSDDVDWRIKKLQSINIDDRYQYRKADAALAYMECEKTLAAVMTDALNREEKEAELVRLQKAEQERKQKEREEQIRQEAAAKAKRDAEIAAQRKIDEANRQQREAEENARRQKEAAARREEELKRQADEQAKRAAQAERERIEKERADAEAKAEAERKADEAKRKRKAHRATIQNDIIYDLSKYDIDSEFARLLISEIESGIIRHLTINY